MSSAVCVYAKSVGIFVPRRCIKQSEVCFQAFTSKRVIVDVRRSMEAPQTSCWSCMTTKERFWAVTVSSSVWFVVSDVSGGCFLDSECVIFRYSHAFATLESTWHAVAEEAPHPFSHYGGYSQDLKGLQRSESGPHGSQSVSRLYATWCQESLQSLAVTPAAQLVLFNASILSWKRRPYIQRKHFGHHMTDLHMLASPQLLVADMRGHMDTCWPLDAPQLAEGTVHAQFHTISHFTSAICTAQAVPTSNYVPTKELRATNLWQKAATCQNMRLEGSGRWRWVFNLDAICIHMEDKMLSHKMCYFLAWNIMKHFNKKIVVKKHYWLWFQGALTWAQWSNLESANVQWARHSSAFGFVWHTLAIFGQSLNPKVFEGHGVLLDSTQPCQWWVDPNRSYSLCEWRGRGPVGAGLKELDDT